MTEQIISAKFMYDGSSRIVDNVVIDEKKNVLIGFEMRKGGRFSYKTKKFSRSKINDLVFIDPLHRSGPRVGRP